LTKNEAITLLFRDKECYDYCYKVSGKKRYADDLMQYAMEELLMKDENFIVEKYKDGSLKRYFAGIVYKSFNYPTSRFYIDNLKFSKMCIPINDAQNEVMFKSISNKQLEFEISQYENKSERHWFEASVLRLYFRYGSLPKLAKESNIPISSLYDAINSIRKHLKKIICEKYY